MKKRKRLRKVLAIALTMAMVMGMGLTASADSNGVTGTDSDTGSVTISGVAAGDKVDLYQIVEATYTNNGKTFTGYEVLQDYADVIELDVTQEDNELGEMNIDATEITDASALVARNQTAVSATETVLQGATSVTITGLSPGSYLVKVTPGEGSTTIYSAAVVSLYYVNSADNTATNLEQGNLVLTSTDTYVKKQDEPTLDKQVYNTDTNEWDNDNSANIGDTVQFKIVVDIPSYTGSYPVFKITDNLDGMTYEKTKSITVKASKNDETDTPISTDQITITPTNSNKTVVWNFVIDENEYVLQEYYGQKLEIIYTATVDNTAHLDEIPNTNKAKLTYTSDPSVNGKDTDTPDEKTYTYVFDIDGKLTGDGATSTKENVIDTLYIINKIGEVISTKETTIEGETIETGKKLPLEGAEFTLYTDSSCSTVYTNSNFKGTVESSVLGQLHIKGIAAGTYYLKETKAPEGYSINAEIVKIEISYVAGDDGVMTSWTVKINDTEIATFTVTQTTGDDETVTVSVIRNQPITEKAGDAAFSDGYDILNTKLTTLPSTGGIGTTIFTIGGIVIMVVAAALFFANRKKKNV